MRCLLALVLLSSCAEDAPPPLRRGEAPNLLLIVADDLGWGDLGCYGATDARTPALDALAAGGVRCTDFYVASPVCSPSRASLLTGRAPWRHGLAWSLVAEEDAPGLDPGERLLPELLRGRGYATGLVGKWHLGDEPAQLPTRRGFDEFFGMLGASNGYFTHTWRGRPDLWRGETPVEAPGAYSTDLFADEALAFLERHADDAWFLVAAFNAPHLADDRRSLPSPEEYRALFPDATGRRGEYLAVVAALDAAIGRLLARLDELGLAEDTLVVFLSDNGPAAHAGGSAGPFARGKDTLDEGGIRVPCLLRWPGHLAPAGVCTEPLTSMDLMPTLLPLAGVDTPAELDGRDVLQTLSGRAPSPHEALVWDHASRVPEAGGGLEHDRVVRRGRWRLTEHQDGSRELHDLAQDPGQEHDVAGEQQDLVDELAEWLSR